MRVTLRLVLLGELVLALASLALSGFVPAVQWELRYLAGMMLVALVMHALLLLFRTPAFVIHDEPPGSIFKYYWFFTIFAAALLGGFLADAIAGGIGG